MKMRFVLLAVSVFLSFMVSPLSAQIVETAHHYVGIEKGRGVKVRIGPNLLIAVKTPKSVVIRYVPGEKANVEQWIEEFREDINSIVVLGDKVRVPKNTKVYDFEKQGRVSLDSAAWPAVVPTTVVTSGVAFHFNESMVYNDKEKTLKVFDVDDLPATDLDSGLVPVPKFQGTVTCSKSGEVTVMCAVGGGTLDLPYREQLLFHNFLSSGIFFITQQHYYMEEFDVFHSQVEFLAKQPESEPEPDHGKSTAIDLP